MTDMKVATCNCLFNQFCGAYRLGLYKRDDLHQFFMSNWQATLDYNKPQNKSSAYDITNNKIKALMVESYPAPTKLLKYKKYDTFFVKRKFDEVFKSVPKRSQVAIEAKQAEKYMLLTINILIRMSNLN